MKEINFTTKNENHSFEEEKTLNVINQQHALIVKYHTSEITQNKNIVRTAVIIIWCGFAIICMGIIVALIGKIDVAIMISSSGVLLDFISSIILAFTSMSSKSKMMYFEQLALSQEGEQYIQMVYDIKDENIKGKLIEKLIDNYGKRKT